MLHSGLMRIYHSSKTSREKFRSFLEGLAKLLEHRRFFFSLSYKGGEFAYGVSADDEAMPIFTSKFYSEF